MSISIEAGLYSRLTTDAGIIAITTNIYHRVDQDSVFPCLTYQLISPESLIAHDGMSGIAHPRYQITGWDIDHDVVISLMEKVRISLNGFKGTWGAGANTVIIQACLLDGGMDLFEPETQRWFRAQDYFIWHAENIS